VLYHLRWFIPYLLFGYLILVTLFVFVSLAMGRESLSISVSGPLLWLLALPFWLSILVMLQSLPFLLAIDLCRFVLAKSKKSFGSKRTWAWASLVIVAGLSIYTPTRILLERSTLRVLKHQVGTGTAPPFRIVFLGDIQQDNHTDQERADQVVKAVNHEDADLILYGGDWIATGSEFVEAAAKTGGKFRSRLGTLSVVGDHEHFAYRDQQRSVREVKAALAKQKVDLIDNEIRWFNHAGKKIAVVFLNYNYIYRTTIDEVQQLLKQVQGADYSILLTHQFDAPLASVAKDKVDLILGAHTHGGQVNPLIGFTHVSLARVETEHVEGRYRLSKRTTLIVTAGIGFSIAPFRYASPPAIEVIEVRPGAR
jgi:predicted MPP superfamily phosphohydrolase